VLKKREKVNMSDDLVKRLRDPFYTPSLKSHAESADRIEKLEEQIHYANGVADLAMKHRDYAEQRVEKLEAALRLYACDCKPDDGCGVEYYDGGANCGRTARNALEGKDD